MGRGDAVGRDGGDPVDRMPAGAPSEAELQALLLQMREAPVEQVLAEVVNVLFQTIQVKLGLPDARVLIDVAAGLAEATAGRIDPALHSQVSQALSQLRLAQVEEERQQGTAPAGPPVAPSARGPAPTTPSDPKGGDATSRLWVPGR